MCRAYQCHQHCVEPEHRSVQTYWFVVATQARHEKTLRNYKRRYGPNTSSTDGS